VGWLIGVGGEFNFDHGNVAVVLDEGAGVVGSSKEWGLSSESQTYSTEDCTFSGSVWTTHDVEPVIGGLVVFVSDGVCVCVCGIV